MSADGFIYFLRPVGMRGPIKIGFSAQPEKRLEALAIWSPFPLEIALRVPGTFRLEKNLHECLAQSHSHREWFHATDKVLGLLAALEAGKPIEEAIDLSAREGRMPRKSVSAEARLRGTYLHRLRHHPAPPEDVQAILRRWSPCGRFEVRRPSESELARLAEVLPYRGRIRALQATPEPCAP